MQQARLIAGPSNPGGPVHLNQHIYRHLPLGHNHSLNHHHHHHHHRHCQQIYGPGQHHSNPNINGVSYGYAPNQQQEQPQEFGRYYGHSAAAAVTNPVHNHFLQPQQGSEYSDRLESVSVHADRTFAPLYASLPAPHRQVSSTPVALRPKLLAAAPSHSMNSDNSSGFDGSDSRRSLTSQSDSGGSGPSTALQDCECAIAAIEFAIMLNRANSRVVPSPESFHARVSFVKPGAYLRGYGFMMHTHMIVPLSASASVAEARYGGLFAMLNSLQDQRNNLFMQLFRERPVETLSRREVMVRFCESRKLECAMILVDLSLLYFGPTAYTLFFDADSVFSELCSAVFPDLDYQFVHSTGMSTLYGAGLLVAQAKTSAMTMCPYMNNLADFRHQTVGRLCLDAFDFFEDVVSRILSFKQRQVSAGHVSSSAQFSAFSQLQPTSRSSSNAYDSRIGPPVSQPFAPEGSFGPGVNSSHLIRSSGVSSFSGGPASAAVLGPRTSRHATTEHSHSLYRADATEPPPLKRSRARKKKDSEYTFHMQVGPNTTHHSVRLDDFVLQSAAVEAAGGPHNVILSETGQISHQEPVASLPSVPVCPATLTASPALVPLSVTETRQSEPPIPSSDNGIPAERVLPPASVATPRIGSSPQRSTKIKASGAASTDESTIAHMLALLNPDSGNGQNVDGSPQAKPRTSSIDVAASLRSIVRYSEEIAHLVATPVKRVTLPSTSIPKGPPPSSQSGVVGRKSSQAANRTSVSTGAKAEETALAGRTLRQAVVTTAVSKPAVIPSSELPVPAEPVVRFVRTQISNSSSGPHGSVDNHVLHVLRQVLSAEQLQQLSRLRFSELQQLHWLTLQELAQIPSLKQELDMYINHLLLSVSM